MKNNCLRCQAELKEITQPGEPGEPIPIKTYACPNCGYIENRMKPAMVKLMTEGKKND